MKKVALILLAIGLVVVSCKKETPQPNVPVAPLQDTTLPDTTGNGGGSNDSTVVHNLGIDFVVTTKVFMSLLDSIHITQYVNDSIVDILTVPPTDLMNMGLYIRFNALSINTNKHFVIQPNTNEVFVIDIYLNGVANNAAYDAAANRFEFGYNDNYNTPNYNFLIATDDKSLSGSENY